MLAIRILRAGVAGAVAWWVGLFGIFGSLQSVLGDPELQSQKMIAVYEMAPPARIVGDPWLLPAAMLVVALIQAAVFAYLRPALPRSVVKSGLAFAAVAWALFVPWFEFYLPWSLLLEPTWLVAIELLCWAGLMLLVGLAISAAFGRSGMDRNA